jgi:hypothetical protein
MNSSGTTVFYEETHCGALIRCPFYRYVLVYAVPSLLWLCSMLWTIQAIMDWGSASIIVHLYCQGNKDKTHEMLYWYMGDFFINWSCISEWFQALPMVLLSKIHFFREALLRPAISNKDEHVISGLTYLLSEIGQVVSIFVIKLWMLSIMKRC